MVAEAKRIQSERYIDTVEPRFNEPLFNEVRRDYNK